MLIVIEGIDGAGKTTVARELERELATIRPVIYAREPGGTEAAEKIRAILKGGEPLAVMTEQFLFQAARAQLVEYVVRPALEEGTTVILDRYTYSTLAYGNTLYGLNSVLLATLNSAATARLEPDLVLLLDLPAEVAKKRRLEDAPRTERDRYDHLEPETMEKVRQFYLTLATQRHERDRWRVIDADRPHREVVLGCLAHILLHVDTRTTVVS